MRTFPKTCYSVFDVIPHRLGVTVRKYSVHVVMTFFHFLSKVRFVLTTWKRKSRACLHFLAVFGFHTTKEATEPALPAALASSGSKGTISPDHAELVEFVTGAGKGFSLDS